MSGLDYVLHTPMRQDWRLFVGFALIMMGLGCWSLARGFWPRWAAAGLAAMSVGAGLLGWAAA